MLRTELGYCDLRTVLKVDIVVHVVEHVLICRIKLVDKIKPVSNRVSIFRLRVKVDVGGAL